MKLNNDNHGRVDGNDNIKPLVCDYFCNLFSSGSGKTDHGLMVTVRPLVTSDMNEFLNAPYT